MNRTTWGALDIPRFRLVEANDEAKVVYSSFRTLYSTPPSLDELPDFIRRDFGPRLQFRNACHGCFCSDDLAKVVDAPVLGILACFLLLATRQQQQNNQYGKPTHWDKQRP